MFMLNHKLMISSMEKWQGLVPTDALVIMLRKWYETFVRAKTLFSSYQRFANILSYL